MPSLKDLYDFEDFAEFPFGRGFWLRLGRSGLKPFQDHMSAFWRKANAAPSPGARQRRGRAQPSEDAVNDAMREGIMAHLWGGGNLHENTETEDPATRGPAVRAVTDAEFHERLYDDQDQTFFADVILCIGDLESYRRKGMEDAAKNLQPSSEPSFA
jgi:hypothetical protein